MKRVITSVACVILTFAMAFTAMAAGLDTNKQKIMDAVNQTITVNGKTVGLSVDQKTQAENYLQRSDVSISDDQAATVVEQINKAVAIVKSSNVDDLNKLSSEEKAKVIDNIQKAANAIGLTVSVNSANSSMTILDKNNTVVASFNNVIKTTGPDVSMAVVFLGFVLVLLTGCAVIAHKSKLGAK